MEKAAFSSSYGSIWLYLQRTWQKNWVTIGNKRTYQGRRGERGLLNYTGRGYASSQLGLCAAGDWWKHTKKSSRLLRANKPDSTMRTSSNIKKKKALRKEGVAVMTGMSQAGTGMSAKVVSDGGGTPANSGQAHSCLSALLPPDEILVWGWEGFSVSAWSNSCPQDYPSTALLLHCYFKPLSKRKAQVYYMEK